MRITKIFVYVIFSLMLLSSVISTTAFATPPSQTEVKVELANGEFKTIQLIKVKLPKVAKTRLVKNMSFALSHPVSAESASSLPPQIDLGMNNVPVLDQGRWGTCVTFATAAAIDAFYPLKGDQAISELCNLQLGRTLQTGPESDGGWEGSLGYIILNQINEYGYLPKSWQSRQGCGGLKEYPVADAENGAAMSIADFTANSIHTFTHHHWKVLLQDYNPNNLFDSARKERLLTELKQNLAAGYRATIGVLIDPIATNIGITGQYNGVTATWVLTEEIVEDIKDDFIAGHAMVITGYDDNACASYWDENTYQSKTQCGLLKLRNSWGTQAGDHGNYYMSYAYFKNLTIETYLIGKS